MAPIGLEPRISRLLATVNAEEGYSLSLVCTDQGLLVAASGDQLSSEHLAGLTSLFDDIVVRARRDLSASLVDEVTLLLDRERGRLVIRPLPLDGSPRLFLVLQIPARATWRRNTNRLLKTLADWLGDSVSVGVP